MSNSRPLPVAAAAEPFIAIFDEMGYYASPNFAAVFQAARSLMDPEALSRQARAAEAQREAQELSDTLDQAFSQPAKRL